MTQHARQEDTDSDRIAMRNLSIVIGAFAVATIIMATVVGLVMS